MKTPRFIYSLFVGTALAGCMLVGTPAAAQTYTSQPIAASSGIYGTYPYQFTGLLTTSLGSGSGAVVGNPRVVYSCAHVVFNSAAVDPWLSGIRWHRAWASSSYPASSAGQLLRGYYFYVGYTAAARINKGSDSSFSQDFVVHYAYENTANGGHAGKWNDGVFQLKSASAKIITGYPAGLYLAGDSRQYLMHQTGPFNRAYSSSLADYLVIDEVSAGPGNSGGPVWVSDGTQYYFAGVHVSGSVRSLDNSSDRAGVYGVDDSSLALINDAISTSAAPVITTQPTSRRVNVGASADFAVAASGTNLSYRWLFNGSTISGATGATLSLSNVSPARAGTYQVVVSNAAGEVSSLVVTLSVDVPPAITAQPVARSVAPGGSVTLSVTATGSGPLTYQWYRDGVALAGASGASYTISTAQLANAGRYSVTVTNVAGTVTSAPAHVNLVGLLWAMGNDTERQLGIGTPIQRETPLAIANGVTAAVAGWSHSLYLKTDGTLWATGGNSSGQLGDGTTVQRNSPVQVASGVSAVATGAFHSLYLKTDGTLWAMGRNTEGQLGDGSTTQRNSPVQVATGVSAVAAGGYHSLYLKTDGSLWAMGRNTEGQLGDGTTVQRNSPVQVVSGASAVCAGLYHTLYLKTDGTVWATGRNTEGQLGDSTTTQRNSPVQVATGMSAVAAGAYYSFHLRPDGTLWAMGFNGNGQLGDGTSTQRNLPVQVATGVSAVSAGQYHSLYLRSDRTLWAMGYNGNGQLGDGTTTQRNLPVQVATGVSAVAAGAFHSWQLKIDGTLWATGSNSYGQLGDGTITHRRFPVRVAADVSAVAAGAFHSLYLKADGTLWAIGDNSYGQLGDGTTVQRDSPVQVASGVSAVAAGWYHSLYLKTDGSLWAMGYNSQGQLGDGTTAQRNSPVQVATGVSAVAAGGYHSMYLKTEGTLWAMGRNTEGQLGDGTTTQRNSPGQVATGVSAMAAGGYHGFCLKTDGTLWAMGFNGNGQLGDGTTTPRSSPVQVAAGVSAVSAGLYHSLFLKSDGTLWAIGYNGVGQLGDGTTTQRNSAVQVASNVLTVIAGEESSYFIQAAGVGTVPSVTAQPVGGSYSAGAAATLTVAATGSGPLDYRWRKDGVDVPGARSATLTIPFMQASYAGSYSVIVTNSAGNVTSSAATVALNVPPVFTTQPQSQTVNVGANITFTVAASGTPSPTYQWKKGAADIGGATNATLTLSSVQADASGSYSVVATNAAGSAASNAVTLTVNAIAQTPVITAVSAPRQVVTVGESLTLSVTASGATSYQWKRNGLPIQGATSATYSITSAAPERDNGWYLAVVTNISGSAASAAIFVSVNFSTAVFGWGRNVFGETTIPSGLTEVVAISAGWNYSVARRADGTVAVWGVNSGGQATIPSGVSEVVGIAAGARHILALKSDGTVVDWGENTNGYARATIPSVLSGVVAIAAGLEHNLALKSDGTVVGWGSNAAGKTTIPIGLTSVVAIAVGAYHSLALKSDGTVVAWGSNASGQTTIPIGVGGVMAIAAGGHHSLALKSDGTVVGWGSNGFGQTTIPSGLGEVVAIAAGGGAFSLALKSDGTVVGWGDNSYGETTVPVWLGGVLAIAAGDSHSLVLRDGRQDQPPAITAQPIGQAKDPGQSVTFTVVGTGNPAPTYQWRKGGTAVSGATAGSYTILAVAASDAGAYTVTVTNSLSSVTSSVATLTVNLPQIPVITTQPAAQVVLVGSAATFTVAATNPGSGSLSYRWYFTPAGSVTPQALTDQAGKFSGTRTATLTVSNIQTSDTGDYVCVVTNTSGDTTSNAAPLSIAAHVVRIVSQSTSAGANAVVPVQLMATGSENAVGFTILFDPAKLTYVSAVVGAQAVDATLNTNSSQIAAGKLGIALAKPAGVTWAAGTQEVIKVTFTVNASLAGGTVAALTFGDSPVVREISDATANALPGGYQGGAITVASGFEADMNGNGAVSITDWVKVGRIVAGLDVVASGIDFQKADCAGRTTLGNGVLSISDWVQAGRYAASLDPLTPAGGPTAPNP